MEDKEDKKELMNKEELMTLPTPQGTSHCSCIEHCFLFMKNTGDGKGTHARERSRSMTCSWIFMLHGVSLSRC